LPNAIFAFALLGLLTLGGKAVAQEQLQLQATSDHGAFLVKITWTPDEMRKANKFDIMFIDPETGREIEDIAYDISIYNGNSLELQRTGQLVTHQEFSFSNAGSYTIRISNIDGLVENVSIPIQVTPEFPAGTLAISMTIIGMIIYAARRNSNSLFSSQDN
jgi:hypothetical protein